VFAEPGAETVVDVIAAGAAMGPVNLAEVATVLVRHRRDPEKILRPVREQLAVEPFTHADALAAAALYPKDRGKGSVARRPRVPRARTLTSPCS
jgi:PIN domain nuclease of toxin-antitoxin system